MTTFRTTATARARASIAPHGKPSRLVPAWRQMRGRLVLAGSVGTVALAVNAVSTSLPSDVDAFAKALGEATGGVAHARDLRWEPSGGIVSDLFFGRFVLFLAGENDSSPRDVYRARVRLSPEGRPLSIASLKNLTSTPLGDDHALVVSGARAAYATFAFGQEQSVTVLDLDGEGLQNMTRLLHDRAMAWVTNVQQTGSGDGVGRVDVTFDQPASRVGLRLGAEGLEVELEGDARVGRRHARFDLARGELDGAPAGMHAEAGRHLPKRPVFWAVDTVRAVPWIGPAPVAWLEERVFALRDSWKRTAFKVTGGGEALATKADEPPPASVLDASQASADLGHWPPSNIRSIWKTPEAGEGEWEVPKQAWIKRLPAPAAGEAPPSPFYRTYVRPDEDRPYAKVLLVAMDMRQLDLDMEAGSEDPKPMTGPPGTGRIPRDPAVYTRIAAAYNGGFKTEHGNYGMMLKKRVLLPPVAGAATIVITKDGRYGMGSWGNTREIGGIVDLEPTEITSFRQNLDALVDSDKLNPLGRAQWGYTLPGTSMQTERSGICVTNTGHMLYAWGDDVSATTLGKAMKMASCVYGMHLDMNPHHTGFIFTNITELKGRNYKSELLSTQMEISPDRYIEYAPKDFFYMTLHDPAPPPVTGVAWQPDPGTQPAPSWMAGLWRGESGDVELFDVEPGRASFRLRAGTKEPDSRAARAAELSDDDAHRVVFALTLGVSTDKRPRGLSTDGKVALAMSNVDHAAALVAAEDGSLSIVLAKDFSQAPHADAAELPLVLDDGKAVPTSPAHGRSPVALGLSPQGRTFVARAKGQATVDDLANALKKAGCTRAVLLDRGAGSHGAMFRAGTETPPRSRYEETTLYAMGKPLLPRGFRFEPKNPVEPVKPKK